MPSEQRATHTNPCLQSEASISHTDVATAMLTVRQAVVSGERMPRYAGCAPVHVAHRSLGMTPWCEAARGMYGSANARRDALLRGYGSERVARRPLGMTLWCRALCQAKGNANARRDASLRGLSFIGS